VRVTILGHASLFFEAGEQRVLLDPVLRTTSLMGSLVHQYPRTLRLDQLPSPTLIIVSHAHFDHFDPATLEKLPKDVPILVPPDRAMTRALGAMGFAKILHLNTWESLQHGSLRFTATPSDAPVTEFGLLVETEGARLWQMSDAEPPADTARKIVAENGPVDVVCAKFQPTDAQLNFQHNMGSTFDRNLVASWLEIACACSPKLAFPYASALCFSGERAWLNRYAYPLSAEFVADLLAQRLRGIGTATIVRPGDVVIIERHDPDIRRQASDFVCTTGPAIDCPWEPFEGQPFEGFSEESELQKAEESFARVFLEGEFQTWLTQQAVNKAAKIQNFFQWKVLCQVVLHLGSGKRFCFQIDFSLETPQVRPAETALANYCIHVAGPAAVRLLKGSARPLATMLEGNVRIYERLIVLQNGHIEAPPLRRLYEDLPDPVLTFFGSRRRKATEQTEGASS
jgi:hypothetical protein